MRPYIIRFTAKVMLVVMILQLVLPATDSFALTTGPSQPEVQSFEPVGTTDMVDLFSGDFVYNIPLLDIEGYPVNISYHSGINMEQESSWVGLGWNINPGEVGRAVRGVPDDFNGDSIYKNLHIKDEIEWDLKGTVSAKPELFGNPLIKAGLYAGIGVTFNNYKGTGVTLDAGVNARFNIPIVSPQIGMGVSAGSLDGATVNANAGLAYTTNVMNGSSGTLSLSGSTGFNTRSGLKNIGLGWQADFAKKENSLGKGGLTSIPVGLQNYVSVVTNASTVNSWSFSLKLGPAILGGFLAFEGSLGRNITTYDTNGSRASYGYLYAQNSDEKAIMDFSREKDGMYNSTMPNLPLSSMTYDIYSITGQGTGGMFRPFRNDFGTVFDPVVESHSDSKSVSIEGGMGSLYEVGANITEFENDTKSGPWYRKFFTGATAGSVYEPTYFKQAGEMTYSLQQDNALASNHSPILVSSASVFLGRGGNTSLASVPGTYSISNRSARANHLSYLNNWECAKTGIGMLPQKPSYSRNSFSNGDATASNITQITRTGSTASTAKNDHIGEMTQVLPDGRRYVYGLPAMNNLQKEVTFAVSNANADINAGLVSYSDGDDSKANTQGLDNYYQATYTPAYAHSYLLTAVLSPEYMDILGDGLTEDDLGSYTKLTYTRTDADFRWIAPIQAAASDNSGTNKAQYNPGYWSDIRDDKGNYTIGSREMWYIHSIESKNMIAEFYTSARLDGRGVKKKIVQASDKAGNNDNVFKNAKTGLSESYKLDSIKLYNRHERITNPNAVPVKTVIFAYDYSLCPGVPNRDLSNTSAGTGKLTLKRIYFRYGNSDKSLLNPYEFSYNQTNNKPYSFEKKDRWGNFKEAETGELTNYEFPYVKQDKTEADGNANSWHLTGIKLPSGGNLKIAYEADDYSYVQDKRTMEMFRDISVGATEGYAPKNVLYEDIAKQYDYIYFTRSIGREMADRSPKDNYLQGEDMVYFSFSVDLAAKGSYENIKGYAKVEDVGYCSDNIHGFIKVQKESAGGNSNEKINPVTLATLNTGRLYLPHIIYPGYNTSDPVQILKALAAAGKELIDITKNANVSFIGKSFGKRFKPGKSWVRLHTPGYTKIGGGSRVSSLKIDDGWYDMTSGSGFLSEYGQNYKYTTLLDNKFEISSGVASYEPMIGSDEIPQHQPANKYTADGGRLLPAIQFNQEEPFGESFYPSPSVGYSKVTVTSINLGKDGMDVRSAKNMNVQEFYTAKDFPIKTDFTDKRVPVNQKDYSVFNRFEEVNVLQGYVLRMNDMHGKPKMVSNYVIKSNLSSTEPSYELITSTKYNYQTQDGELYNKVRVVKRGSLVRPTYSITDMVLGEESDFTIDSRKREIDSRNMHIDANLNVMGLGVFTVPVPSLFFPDTHEKSVFKTMVSTKIIQQYGILKSVETVDHGARVLSENMLYDSETGQVLLTRVNNEYNDPISNVSLPAYWAYDYLGPSYFNTGYEEVLDSIYVDSTGKGYLLDVVDKRNFNEGDELMITVPQAGHPTSYIRVWVTGMGMSPRAALPTMPTYAACNTSSPCGIEPPNSWCPTCTNRWCSSTGGGTWAYMENNGNTKYIVPPGTSTWVAPPLDYTAAEFIAAYPPYNTTTPSTPAHPSGVTPIYVNSTCHWEYTDNEGTYYFLENPDRWVGPYDQNGNTAPVAYNCNKAVPIIEPRAKYPTGTTTGWLPFKRGYNNVSLKVLRSGRKNLLGEKIEEVSMKGNFVPSSFAELLTSNYTNVLSATAKTYAEHTTDEAFQNTSAYGFNDFILGLRGVFRERQTYGYLASRVNSGHNRTSGVFSSFQNFLVSSTNAEPCSFWDIVAATQSSGNWKLLKWAQRYSAYGMPTEEVDAAGIHSSALFGYNRSLPIAVGSNISYEALKYFNFEDLLQVQHENRAKLDVWEMLKPTTVPTSPTYYRDGSGYKVYGSTSFGTNTEIRSDQSHTGKYSMLFTATGKIRLANTYNYQTSGDRRFAYVSMWIRPVSGSPSTSSMYIQGYGQQSNATASQDFTAFSLKTNSIDGWYKVEGKLDMSLLAPYLEVYLKMPAGYYVDDIRLYPDAGNMKSFAYDVSTMRLMAELDENNFATFYEYDQEGVLIRVKKESDRGILTVSENRKSNAKNVQ